MNCWHCKTELIWGGDEDLEDDDDHCMVTNLSCPECNSLVYVYMAKKVTRRVIAAVLEPGLNALFGTDYERYEGDSDET